MGTALPGLPPADAPSDVALGVGVAVVVGGNGQDMNPRWTRQTIERPDGIRLACWVREADRDDAPTIVLVHGYPDTHLVWTDVVDRLPSGYRVVTYDTRGAGDSTAPVRQEGYELERLADDLAAVIRLTTATGTAHVVGHDWGGITGFEAIMSPRTAVYITSFTALCAPSLDRTGEWARRRLRPSRRWVSDVATVGGQALRWWYVGAFQLPLAPRVMAAAAPALVGRIDGLPPERRPVASTASQDAANGVALYRANLRQVGARRQRPVRAPLQLILGEDDRFVSPRLHDDLHEWASEAKRVVLPGGHWLPVTDAAAVGELITALVDAVEAEVRPMAHRSG